MRLFSKSSVLGRCDRGAAAVEFAMVLPVLCVVIMGTLELGYRIYAVSVTNGAIRNAARMASTGGYTGTQIDDLVTKQIHAFRKDATVQIVEAFAAEKSIKKKLARKKR